MKKLLLPAILYLLTGPVEAQVTKTDVLQDLEKNQPVVQDTMTTATIRTATRLFKDKDDLTSVIIVIPVDSIVTVVGSDDTFLNVDYLGNKGFIYSKHAIMNKKKDPEEIPVVQSAPEPTQEKDKNYNDAEQKALDRYNYLERKYGSSIASKLSAGKIWKGMNAQMVKDSWGSPRKIDRVINGNAVNEDWFYSNTWLHFQNSTLVSWGPVKN